MNNFLTRHFAILLERLNHFLHFFKASKTIVLCVPIVGKTLSER